MKQQIIDMNARLLKASEAYYKKNQPIMSDAEFDKLERQLKQLVAENPEFKALATILASVGTDLTANGGRIPHARPMLSIENQYQKEDVVAFFTGLQSTPTICLFESKQDGISAELCFKNGVLVQAVTRGTGTEGEDMTAQVKVLQSIPKTLQNTVGLPCELRIRGELVMRDSELDRINANALSKGQKTYASTRNLTAGTMKQKNLTVVAGRDIILMPWDVYSPTDDGDLPDSAYDRMRLLESMGFSQYKGMKVNKVADVIPAIDIILGLNAKSDIRADGVVIKVDSHKLRHKLGVGTKYTNYQTCFKPQSAVGETYLRAVEWQVGRSGKLTPVGVVDPITLAGAVITNVTLNNMTWIQNMGLKINSKVRLVRSGDCIPLITGVLDDEGIQ